MADPVTPPAATPAVAATVAPAATPTVPDKFKAADGTLDSTKLLASYTELEKKVGTKEAPSATPAVQATPAPKKIAKWQAEFTTNGNTLKPETYAEIESDLGLNKAEVDAYISGRVGAADTFNQSVFEAAGGQERYAQIAGWADTNLKPEEIESYNRTLKSGDLGQIKVALKGLVAQYDQQKGRDPTLINGTSTAGGGIVPFANANDAAKAKQDRRYGRDPDYTKLVSDRLKASKY